MSYFSVVNLILVFFLLPCIFFYHPWWLLGFVAIWLVLYFRYISWEFVLLVHSQCKIGFWLFIMSEVVIFLTLMFNCFWFNDIENISISYSFSVPIIETYLLVMSSLMISMFHSGVASDHSSKYIYLALLFSLVFICFAVDEFFNSSFNSLCSPYYASCFMLVGLHLSHVVVGSLGLIELIHFNESELVRSKSEMIVIYWHFVDFIWLLVFIVVYISNNKIF
uniref:Cytochrome c oxidase subunit 3 n=2 Tax=Schistosoma haematobium TaxID=6185 RepID=Q1I0P3_SCHHA|nr:cytochrome c oxidase subunit III [Schistosoma haematobium]AAZ57308.1 cytochrome c oxidase subunit III [Schistosoma haematobium]QDO72028.1 cytochrome c oxidase subunit III [Schistosoma haematobium]QDO72124.1 cytochrome c oxidase subunit III [Schistosoma haematobium]QDO72135.1 cytochrome c oxidase subunit III [Schistosoma haematobium]QDO72147.1 cytochrome c oxidase subunit III [Schistosoma haematobium]